jgi:hypothetical protein
MINSLFKPSNLYILFSQGFRKYFQMDHIFDNNKKNRTYEQEISMDSEIHANNSNKSILENLLT